jgi:hypothetical protein
MEIEMKNICLDSHSIEGEKSIALEVMYSDNSEYYPITAYFLSDWRTWVAITDVDWETVEGYLCEDGVEDYRLTLVDGNGEIDDLILIGQRDGDVYFAIGDINRVEFEEE